MPRYGALFSLGAVLSLSVLVMLNAWRYGSALSFGYGQSGSNLHGIRARGAILTGLWGQWLSPGKSIFLYAPFVLLAVAGIVVSVRRLPAEMSLLIALVVANTLFFARVRFWHGDWAWGPRYMIIVLPCLAVMCAPLVGFVRWRRALAALGAIGFLFPGALGVLVNFNIFYLRARAKLGNGFLNTVYHDWSWQPIWRHIGVLSDELGNVGKPYGLLYLTGKPRLDIWWLDDRWWLTQHPNRFAAALMMLLFIAALGRRRLRHHPARVAQPRDGCGRNPGVDCDPVGPERRKVRVAYIAGAGFSGSTLLEQALSQVEGCVSVGEPYRPLFEPYWPEMTCGCGEEFRDCPFWQAVLADAYGDEQEATRERLRILGEGFVAHSVRSALTHSTPRHSLGAAFREIGSLIEPMYRAVAARTGAEVIVDASKSGLWGLGILAAPGIELNVVHLVREPRGFALSNSRPHDFWPPGTKTIPRADSLLRQLGRHEPRSRVSRAAGAPQHDRALRDVRAPSRSHARVDRRDARSRREGREPDPRRHADGEPGRPHDRRQPESSAARDDEDRARRALEDRRLARLARPRTGAHRSALVPLPARRRPAGASVRASRHVAMVSIAAPNITMTTRSNQMGTTQLPIDSAKRRPRSARRARSTP